jgi:hypothetical protein
MPRVDLVSGTKEAALQHVRRPGAIACLLVSAALAAAEAAEAPARLKLAQDLARAHAASAAGKEWLARNHARAGELMIPVLQRCVEDSQDGELTSFSTYLRLSQKGKVVEIVTEIDAELDRCMTREAQDVQLPPPPRDDFWLQVNLATLL